MMPVVSELRPSREHDLKTWPESYAAVAAGVKPFEFRRNDRDFHVGDLVVLSEWDHQLRRPFPGVGGGTMRGGYTGRQLRARICHILQGQFGVPEGYAVLGLKDVEITKA